MLHNMTMESLPKTPTFGLLIPVYRGGQLWRDCWESVLPHAHLFDDILISINKSPLQEEDIACVRNRLPGNARLVIHDKAYTGIEHSSRYIQHFAADYYLFLAHDDHLLPQGTKEARSIVERIGGRESIAIFGSYEWAPTDQTVFGESFELSSVPDGILTHQFVSQDIDKYFSFNISGLVFPSAVRVRAEPFYLAFRHGYRLDNFLITLPGIKRIFQTRSPSVQIYFNPAGEAKSGSQEQRELDNISYYFIQALYSAPHTATIRKCVRAFLGLSLRSRNFFFLLGLFCRSIEWPSDNKYYLPIVRAMAIESGQTLRNGIEAIFHAH